MVPLTRRRLLAAAGTATLAGCLSDDGEEPSDDGEDESTESLDPDPLPDDLAAVLETVPGQVGEDAFDMIQLARPEARDDEAPQTLFAGGGQVEAFGLDPDAVDRFATARYGEYTNQLIVASGSFDEDDVDPEEPEGATMYGIEDNVEHVEDGLLVAASGEGGGWDGGLEAATIAGDDPDLGVLAQYPMPAALEPVTDATGATVIRMDSEEVEEDLDDIDVEALELAVLAQELVDETTQEMTLVFMFESASATDRDVAEALVADIEMGMDDAEPEYETVGRRTVATMRGPLPDYQLPDDSPAVHFRFGYEGDGVARIEASGEESADPEQLELLVDGEPVADPPWADRTAPIDDGTSFETEAGLLAEIEVRWNDPEREDVSHSLGQSMLGRNGLFEADYDPDEENLTITYVADEAADPSRLELVTRGPQDDYDEGDPEPLEDRVSELTEDTTIDVDASYGDHVSIRLQSEDDSFGRSVFTYRARPPGSFHVEREDGDSYLVYRGETAKAADSYRLTVPEDPDERWDSEYVAIDTQWADEYDTIEPGDRLALDLEIGAHGRVEWAESDEPVSVSEFQISPEVEFAFDYDEDADEIEITHEGGESLPADELTVTAYREAHEEYDDAFSEYETVSEGDSIVVDAPGEPIEEDEEGAGVHQGFVSVEYRDGISVADGPIGDVEAMTETASGTGSAEAEDA